MKKTFSVKEHKDAVAVNVTLDINFEGVSEDLIRQHAIANMIVSWQSQIRNHWKEFKDNKLPEKVTFGQPLFATKVRTVQAPVTEESAAKFINGQETESARLLTIINIMKAAGMTVTDDILTAYHNALAAEKAA